MKKVATVSAILSIAALSLAFPISFVTGSTQTVHAAVKETSASSTTSQQETTNLKSNLMSTQASRLGPDTGGTPAPGERYVVGYSVLSPAETKDLAANQVYWKDGRGGTLLQMASDLAMGAAGAYAEQLSMDAQFSETLQQAAAEDKSVTITVTDLYEAHTSYSTELSYTITL